MKAKIVFFVVIVILASMVLTACGNGSGNNAPTATPGKVQKGVQYAQDKGLGESGENCSVQYDFGSGTFITVCDGSK